MSQPGYSAMQRKLRFLSCDDLRRLESYSNHWFTFDDFLGVRDIAALPPHALRLAQVTSMSSPMLAATYLRELLPPTSFDELLALVEQLRSQLPSAWHRRRGVLHGGELAALEDCLGRKLQDEDFVVPEVISSLTPHTRAVFLQVCERDRMLAHRYLHEIVPLDDIDSVTFVWDQLRRGVERPRAVTRDPPDN